MNDDWQALVGAKQRELETAIPPEWRVPQAVWAEGRENGRLIEQGVVEKCGILSQRELDMTESYTAADLLHKLATRDLTSVELTTAFSKRAAIAQQLVGLVDTQGGLVPCPSPGSGSPSGCDGAGSD